MKEIKELIMKNPFASICAVLGLLIPYFIALYYFDWRHIPNYGVWCVLIVSVVFSFTPVFLWGFVHSINIIINSKLKNPIMSKEKVNKWNFIISVACILNFTFSFISLLLCYHFKWSFKAFVYISYFVPFIRLLITPVDYYLSIKRLNK